jgi:hypothetical protein
MINEKAMKESIILSIGGQQAYFVHG